MAQRRLDGQEWVVIITAMAEAVQARRDDLTALDSAVGDGDHGVNLARAMTEVARQVKLLESPTPATVLRTAGSTVIDAMGGAAGVIFGSFFRGCGRAVVDRETLDVHDLAEMLAAGLAEVQKRGKAQPGDKTMVDALAPAVKTLQEAAAANLPLAAAVQQAADAARAGAEATKEMVARWGRAKFLGERSIGYQDAGATSMAMMLAAWAGCVMRNA